MKQIDVEYINNSLVSLLNSMPPNTAGNGIPPVMDVEGMAIIPLLSKKINSDCYPIISQSANSSIKTMPFGNRYSLDVKKLMKERFLTRILKFFFKKYYNKKKLKQLNHFHEQLINKKIKILSNIIKESFRD